MSDSAFPFGHFSVAHYHGVQVYKDINLFEEKRYDTVRRGIRHWNSLKMPPPEKNTIVNLSLSDNGKAWKLITHNRSKFEVTNVTARSAIFQYATVRTRIFFLLLFLL